jgi:hypothetical protein
MILTNQGHDYAEFHERMLALTALADPSARGDAPFDPMDQLASSSAFSTG